MQFLRECTSARTRRNIGQIVKLGLYSRKMLRALRRDTGIAYDHRAQGILHFYTTQQEFDAALEPTELMRELGCERRVLFADEAVHIEPALNHMCSQLAEPLTLPKTNRAMQIFLCAKWYKCAMTRACSS